MWDSATLMGALTPKFYVALTGTSSLISGLILIFEWWYFRKYGTSFIEQVSLAHLGPWIGAGDAPSQTHPAHQNNDCKQVWRNPMALLRGAEYGRLWSALRRAPLTYYDMNLSAQEHQAWFGFSTENASRSSDGAEECMQRAWREREPGARVAAARAALARRPDCAPALLLLAEEDAPTVLEAERVFRRAWRAAEAAVRASPGAAEARRAAAVLAHVKRRVGMCARRLGRLRDAARLFRELQRDAPPTLQHMSTHENLIEVLLEQRAYPDVAAVVARVVETGLPPSACLLYTEGLLRARAAATTAGLQGNRGDQLALEAMRRAIEFNPYVPEYLLELRALTLPPEHVERRGDSEAVAYAFAHLPHWRRHEGALQLLLAAWRAHRRCPPPLLRPLTCARSVDAELLPTHHASLSSRRPPGMLPAFICALCAVLALCAHRMTPSPLDPRALLRLLADV